jgi:CYTH domain-containing protein
MSDSPSSGVEIERKFLVDRAPAELPAGERIEQGYLAIGDDGVEVRVRRRGSATTLTIKSGPGMVRTEEEFPIDARRFDSLWSLTEGRRVTKTRHVIPLAGNLAAELDVYSGAHEGLLTAEIEFPSTAASDAFRPPAWLGREVTDDARFANQALALDGRPPRMSGA